MGVRLPDLLVEKALSFPEYSMGAYKVTLTLADGRRVSHVFLAWGQDIIRIGSRDVTGPDDLDFEPNDIADMVSEV